MPENQTRVLKVPGLRARMGDWVYYTASVRLRDIAERISLASEIHKSEALGDLIQRAVESSHSEAIRDYLLHQKERFFNALVIGVYGAAPKWAELSIAGSHRKTFGEIPEYIEGALGILVFDGSEKLFAIDGQHRVVGIKRAVESRFELGEEEVSAIFVGHRTDHQGRERTRRLFTTLNRYAKPVNKMQIIALDEDDSIAITTRRLLEDHTLFTKWTSKKRGKSIPSTDRQNFTTIITVYDTMDFYLRDDKKGWAKFKRFRPPDNILEKYYARAKKLWDGLIKHFPPLAELTASKLEDEIAARYRNRAGGSLLFRPVGISMIVTVTKLFEEQGLALDSILKKLATLPFDLNEEPWVGVLWDPANQRMIVPQENQRAALRLLFHGLGGDLAKLKSSREKLKEELSGILGKAIAEISLPNFGRIR